LQYPRAALSLCITLLRVLEKIRATRALAKEM
jgi:hypothetical protein